MYVIVVYVPSDHVLDVIQAMASAGAGELENYRACAFRHSGVGQFEPKSGAQPFIGSVGTLEVVEEVRLEMFCTEDRIRQALEVMIAAHPYETPAYHVLDVKTLADFT